jgi:hypothetical protein
MNINFEKYFLLIKEEHLEITANPFICSLIGFLLKNKKNVVLIASQENLIHYLTINKKFVILL